MSLNTLFHSPRHYCQRLLPLHRPRFPLFLTGLGAGLALVLAAASFSKMVSPWNQVDKESSSIGKGWVSPAEIVVIQQAMTMEVDLDAFDVEQFALMQRKEALANHIASTYHRPFREIREIVAYAWEVGERYDVDPILLLSIAAVESSFNPKAVSSVGAQGLLQALPRAHPEKFARLRQQGKSPFDPDASLDLGGQIYAEYRARFKGDKVRALQQYNGSLRDPTRRYSNKVLRIYQNLNALAPPSRGDA